MPSSDSPQGRLLLIESLIVAAILVSLVVYDDVSNGETPIGSITISDNVISSPFVGGNYTLISTGKVTGLHDGSGAFIYDVGIFAGRNSTTGTASGSSGEIPIHVSAWIDYGITRNLTSNSGYIKYQSINISYMSSYQYFENNSVTDGTGTFHANSYASSVSGSYNNTRRGSTTTRESTVTFKGTPNPEENVLVNRTYSSTVPYTPYSYGISVPGQWILNQGTGSANTLELSVTERTGVVDSVSSGIFGETLRETQIVLRLVFQLNYTPSSSTWHNGAEISGGFQILKLGNSANMFVSGIVNSTVSKPYF